MNKPELTCIIPVYNTKPAALLEAVMCIVNQTHPAHKIIVVDDGSTDYQTNGILEVINRLPSVQVVWMEDNGGTSVALNYAHKLVNTEYVALMGSDDVCSQDRFKKQMEYLKLNPRVDVLGTQLFSFKDSNILRTPSWKSSHPLKPNSIKGAAGTNGFIVNHGTVIYKNEAVLKCGGYNVACRRGQDVDLWKRMWAKGYKFANLVDILYGWRRYK